MKRDGRYGENAAGKWVRASALREIDNDPENPEWPTLAVTKRLTALLPDKMERQRMSTILRHRGASRGVPAQPDEFAEVELLVASLRCSLIDVEEVVQASLKSGALRFEMSACNH